MKVLFEPRFFMWNVTRRKPLKVWTLQIYVYIIMTTNDYDEYLIPNLN